LPLPGGCVCDPGRNSYRELKYLTRRLVNVTDISEEHDVSIFVAEDEDTIFVRNIDEYKPNCVTSYPEEQ
jgi:hypothetical protein